MIIIKKFKPISYRKGFTLIELMITVSLIVILSAILLQVINPATLRAKTRDQQRVAGLKQIQAALELYFADYRAYPDPSGTGTGSWLVLELGGSDALSTALTPYMDTVPLDPLYEGSTSDSDPCSNGTTNSRYNYWSDGADYVLTAQMEIFTSIESSPCTSIPKVTASCGTGFANSSICYGVVAP